MKDEAQSRLNRRKASALPPTKVIAISNQKGGVGKTTTTLNCAWLATELDTRPALVIDLCTQGNASSTLYGNGYRDAEGITSYDLMTKDDAGTVILQCPDNIELIPSSLDLFAAEKVNEEILLPKFRERVRHLSATNRYSWIFIDTPPTLGGLQMAALFAADYVVIPIGLNKYSMDGLEGLLKAIFTLQDSGNPELEILGILPNLVNASRREQIEALKEIVSTLGDMVLQVPIRDRGPIADAIDRGQAVWKQIRSGNARAAAQEVRLVISDILRRAR